MNDKKQNLDRDIKTLSARTGSGRNRHFAVAVDLSLEGVNKWRMSMGYAPLDRLPGDNNKK